MNNKLLLLSSLSFLLPSYIYKFINSNSNKFMITFINKITTLTSLLFWYSAKENSFFHKIDAKWMRIVVIYSIISILKISTSTIKKCILVFLCLFCFISLLYSDYFSNILWCGQKHIATHILLHVLFTLTNCVYILH
jgi:hypothetical protein